MTNNFDDFGTPLPNHIPEIVSESGGFYQHPIGTYMGFVGKPLFKFKNAQGMYVEPDVTGAKYSHTVLQLWILKYLGTPEQPVSIQFVSSDVNKHLILPDRPIAECYYPLIVAGTPNMQWKNKALFQRWSIPNHPEYNIIQSVANNPAKFSTNVKNLVYYVGSHINFSIISGKNGGSFVNTVDLVNLPRIPKETLTAFFKLIDKKFEEQREQRKSDYQRETPPPVPDFNDIKSEDDLEKFLSS